MFYKRKILKVQKNLTKDNSYHTKEIVRYKRVQIHKRECYRYKRKERLLLGQPLLYSVMESSPCVFSVIIERKERVMKINNRERTKFYLIEIVLVLLAAFLFAFFGKWTARFEEETMTDSYVSVKEAALNLEFSVYTKEEWKLFFDAYKEEYVDMVKAGILDPAKVTRSALQNATSVASTFLTTESAVADIPENNPQPAAANPGMEGMY